MAKRRKDQRNTGFGIRRGKQVHYAPSDPEERYEWAITRGEDVKNRLSKALSRNPQSKNDIRDLFSTGSVGNFMRTGGVGRLRAVYDYYSRSDIQHAIYKYAARRQITFLRLFRPQYRQFMRPEDILPLALCTMDIGGEYWPSLHGTVSKYDSKGKQVCDAILELDYKSSWKKCFEMTRPVVEMLRDNGAVFRMKFSGHCSVHIIIPGEVLRMQGLPLDHSKFFRCLSDIVKKQIKEPRYLDTSFHMPHHFLRLAYSINENTGLVSLPFNVDDYDRFDPSQARPEKVKPLSDWWKIPQDSPQRMKDFIRYVMRGKVVLLSKVASTKIEVEPTTGWQVDPKLVRQVRQRKRQEAREFLPNEGFYDRMVRLGQDAIDLRDFLLLEDESSKIALRVIRHLHALGQAFDLNSIADKFGVDAKDMHLLWNWERRERAFRYYLQDEIKQAIYEYAERRKIRVGNEEKFVFLQEPSDLMPLLVYSHLISPRAQDKYPAIYTSNSEYERTGEIPISCDLKFEFTTRSGDDIQEAASPVFSLLNGFGLTYFILFDGIKGPNIVIPYAAFPEKAKLASVGHENTLAQISPHLKRSMRTPGATCTPVRDYHALSLAPYSIHPDTGLACIPLEYSDLRFFSEEDAWLGNVQVDNDWWGIPEDATVVTAKFLKQMAPIF